MGLGWLLGMWGKTVPSYRFCSTDLASKVQASCTLDAAGDSEACEIAEGLLAEAGFPAIEVWKDGKMIYQKITPHNSN